MTTHEAGFPPADTLPASVMVPTQEHGTLACAPEVVSDMPAVLICGTVGDRSMQWRLSPESARDLASALYLASRRVAEAEARVALEAEAV